MSPGVTRRIGCLAFVMLIAGGTTATAAGPAGAGAVMNLLKSGKVPPERLGPVLEIVCTRGNAEELAYVYERVLQPDALPAKLRLQVLRKLADAAVTRKVVPAGDLSGISGLLESADAALRDAAIALCGPWKVSAAVESLSKLAADPHVPDDTRAAALAAIVHIDAAAAENVAAALTDDGQPFAIRALGIASLTRSDLPRAATLAAAALSHATGGDDPSRMVDAFLEKQGGTDALAAALQKSSLAEDVAKLVLRRMYAVGRSDAVLSAVLEHAAKIAGDVATPAGAELAALIAEINTSGDPARGEAVFRRADLSCLRCHAISQAGGQIGPDLSAVGANSPVDYLINSVYDPDAQIKESFISRVVLTTDGLTLQGIVVDRTDDKLVLKDADGRLHEIPRDDIDDEIAGKSLMPKGLVKFMTHDEIVDLAAFLSQLGRPGPYAVRSSPRMQRWRLLQNVSPELLSDVPNDTSFEDRVLLSGVWSPVYARVDGALPLGEIIAQSKHPVAYVRGEFDVQTAGPIGIRIATPTAFHVWCDSESFGAHSEFTTTVAAGRHSITLRINSTGHENAAVRLELFKPADSPAVFATVDGQ